MTNSVSSIRGTLSEPEAKKIRLNGALVTGLANLPGTTELTLSGITSAFP